MTGLQQEYQPPYHFDCQLNWFDTTCRINLMGLHPKTQGTDCPGLLSILKKIANQIGIKVDKNLYMIQEEEMRAQTISQQDDQMNLLGALHFNKKINQ